MPQEHAARDVHAISEFLLSRVVELLDVPKGAVDRWAPMHQYGLDSLKLTTLATSLSEFLGWKVPATWMWQYPTLDELSRALVEGPRAAETTTAGNDRRTASHEPIAIVGIGCRFPGGPDPSAFWRLLVEGGDAVGPVPAARRDLLNDKVRWGGFIDGIDRFDPLFFGISPREAVQMDPQQRLILELAWEALEDAGVAPHSLVGSDTGVFMASCWATTPRWRTTAVPTARSPRTPRPVCTTASSPTASPTSSACRARAWPSTPPAPDRWSRCTWAASRSGWARASWCWQVA